MSSTSRRLATAAAAGCLALMTALTPAQAVAPQLPQLAELSSYGAGGSSSPLDPLGRPTQETQEKVRAFANQSWVPEDLRNAILTALAFSTGQGQSGGPELVGGAGPDFTQFYWPTVSGNCIGGAADAVGSAIAVPGPTEIPAPGAGPGEMVFLFTALGTSPAAADQGQMQVQWFNLNNFRSGTTPLFNKGINPDGPTTVSGRAATGPGTVIAVLSGTVNTQDSSCRFLPTAAVVEAR